MNKFSLLLFLQLFFLSVSAQRQIIDFNKDWKFFLGDTAAAKEVGFNDVKWRSLQVPHDWSIEGEFSEKHSTTFNQGALPAGIGWYRKIFTLPTSAKEKKVYINFDGVYRNSEVWINGHFIGKRPNGYISFRYDITPHLKHGKEKNIIAVRVDNSLQPSSRWYTGSGIYRKVWLELTDQIAIDHWGTFITTPKVSNENAIISIQYQINNATADAQKVKVVHELYDASNKLVETIEPSEQLVKASSTTKSVSEVEIFKPKRWSTESPYLYKAVTKLIIQGQTNDRYETVFGIRSFYFDAAKGIYLNEKPLKILGV